jgi:hypothetical protein
VVGATQLADVDAAVDGGVVESSFGILLCRLGKPTAEDCTLEWTSWNQLIPVS